MANIAYSVTRWDVSCCHHSHPNQAGYVESVILGITATDSESGKSAYKDERISVPHQPLAEFEANAESFVEGVLGSQGWYLELQTRIAAQLSAPEPAPSGRVQPDFSKMNIGDGYHDLPDVLEEKEPEVIPEEPVEEKKPAAKKKAKKPKEENLAEEEKKEDNAEATPEEESSE